ncbi:hypothetical protein [Pseudovibrio ascidiaceicola]|uniref:hypothetical protein n=1 Tax=Pseudovibrio ascidiaceicola TaxID=285279 RepID=UPI000B882451|nr:hypothetical protein [Pseudovibrio ascidiaceicola]
MDNQQVFYASHHPANTFAEQKNLKVGDKFAIGKWRITPELYAVLVGFTIDEEQSISSNPSYVGLSSTDRHAHSKFRKYFKYRGPKYYPQTATISNYLMSLEYPTDFGQLNAGSKTVLAYASVEFPNKETLAINFAFPKNFVDQHLTLVAADYVEIREVSDLGVKYNVLQSANRVAEDGILNWSEQQQWEVQNNQTVKAEVTSEYKWRVTDAVTGEEVPATPIPKEINYFGKSTQDTPHVVQYDWDQLKKEW